MLRVVSDVQDRFGVDVRAPLDFGRGPQIVQKCIRRAFLGFRRPPRAIFRFSMKTMTKFDPSWDPKTAPDLPERARDGPNSNLGGVVGRLRAPACAHVGEQAASCAPTGSKIVPSMPQIDPLPTNLVRICDEIIPNTCQQKPIKDLPNHAL